MPHLPSHVALLHDIRHGFVPYQRALQWQRQAQNELIQARGGGASPPHIFLVEHCPVITVGVRGVQGLEQQDVVNGISVVKTERGGLATYHGPGQLTCYLVLDLTRPPFKKDLHWLVTTVEQIVIDTLSHEYGVLNATRIAGRSGVWVGNSKISAVGMGCKSWCTIHGLALNIEEQCLKGFQHIVPCGIMPESGSVTSLSTILNRPISCNEVRNTLIREIERNFDITLNTVTSS